MVADWDNLLDEGEMPFYESQRMYEEQEMSNEENIKEIRKDIADIKTNHLITIYRELGKLKGYVWYILGALAVLIPLAIAILMIVVFK